jgi:hypothetical protein
MATLKHLDLAGPFKRQSIRTQPNPTHARRKNSTPAWARCCALRTSTIAQLPKSCARRPGQRPMHHSLPELAQAPRALFRWLAHANQSPARRSTAAFLFDQRV